jgi:hypothetical protein
MIAAEAVHQEVHHVTLAVMWRWHMGKDEQLHGSDELIWRNAALHLAENGRRGKQFVRQPVHHALAVPGTAVHSFCARRASPQNNA